MKFLIALFVTFVIATSASASAKNVACFTNGASLIISDSEAIDAYGSLNFNAELDRQDRLVLTDLAIHVKTGEYVVRPEYFIDFQIAELVEEQSFREANRGNFAKFLNVNATATANGQSYALTGELLIDVVTDSRYFPAVYDLNIDNQLVGKLLFYCTMR